jgi:hypothetical protein
MNKVALFSPPRSGSSWIGSLLHSHPDEIFRFQPLFSYAHQGSISKGSTEEEIIIATAEILNSSDPFAIMQTPYFRFMPDVHNSTNPSHLIWKETRYLDVAETLLSNSDYRVIGLIRNPIDTLESWLNAPKEFDQGWSVMDEWLYAPSKNLGRTENYFGFSKWLEALNLMLRMQKSFPNRFKLITYESFVDSPHSMVAELLEFCKLPLTGEVTDFLNLTLTKGDSNPYSIYKSPPSELRLRLPSAAIVQIEREVKKITSEFPALTSMLKG